MLNMVIEMKRFKELRMTIVCFIIFIGMIILSIVSMRNHQKLQMIIALLCSFIALMMLITRYKIVLFDDMMMIYEWKAIAMFPALIKYEDIKNVEIKSTYHLIVEHKKKSHIYVFNSQKFLEAYNEVRKN